MAIQHIRNEIDRIKAMSMIQDLKKGVHYIIEIKRYQQRKTYPQLKLLFLWYNCIAKETGNTVNAIDEYFKEKFGPKVEVSIFGENKIIPISKADYTVEQMRQYLNAIDSDVSTEGIRLLYPEDQYFEEFLHAHRDYIG